ncbi:Hypothetical protein SSO5983 [Saccharolobus solfataricus P2]|uniref:Uncharacterized protein n=1 Tax=Saccharolobus solfataricus (strain ATCC 35092 / DSM 1617 / JCM 11322 / P2) TaxID=273057 RepID=Q97ZS4_SACS2|nr:Hypothetical protein SSO5983 [Saccharolobus solfataricus P2]
MIVTRNLYNFFNWHKNVLVKEGLNILSNSKKRQYLKLLRTIKYIER